MLSYSLSISNTKIKTVVENGGKGCILYSFLRSVIANGLFTYEPQIMQLRIRVYLIMRKYYRVFFSVEESFVKTNIHVLTLEGKGYMNRDQICVESF